jgi:hypothetical protein
MIAFLTVAAVFAAVISCMLLYVPKTEYEPPLPENDVLPSHDHALPYPNITEPAESYTDEASSSADTPLAADAASSAPPPMVDPVPEAPNDVKEIINKRTHEVICTGAEEGTFDGALFIGDSRTVGFAEKSGVKATYLADVGMDVNRVLSPRFMVENGEWRSLETLVGEKAYKKVYISMGLNEMGWVYSDSFIAKYIDAASRIRNVKPDAVIYVLGIIPVTAEAEEQYSDWGGNAKVREYNDLLRKMCAECGLIYLDVYSAFADENGCLIEEYSSDGVHLSAEGYTLLRECLVAIS